MVDQKEEAKKEKFIETMPMMIKHTLLHVKIGTRQKILQNP